MLNIPYNKTSSSNRRPIYKRAKQGEVGTASESDVGLDITKREIVDGLTRHTFPSSASWAPERLEINGRKGRRVICVLAKDKLHYRVFDVDSPVGNEATEDIDEI